MCCIAHAAADTSRHAVLAQTLCLRTAQHMTAAETDLSCTTWLWLTPNIMWTCTIATAASCAAKSGTVPPSVIKLHVFHGADPLSHTKCICLAAAPVDAIAATTRPMCHSSCAALILCAALPRCGMHMATPLMTYTCWPDLCVSSDDRVPAPVPLTRRCEPEPRLSCSTTAFSKSAAASADAGAAP